MKAERKRGRQRGKMVEDEDVEECRGRTKGGRGRTKREAGW